MRVFAILLCLGVMATPSLADNYQINFTTDSGIGPTAGSFTFDGSMFSNFIVDWNGTVVDLTSEANHPGLNTSGSSCSSAASTPAYGFAIMTQTAVCAGASSILYRWLGEFEPTLEQPDSNNFSFFIAATVGGGTAPDALFVDGLTCSTSCQAAFDSFGGWTVTDLSTTPTPEPSAVILLAFGLLGIALAAKRGPTLVG
jgi:hypothetical protein